MHIRTETTKGEQVVVNLAHVLTITGEGMRSDFRFLPGMVGAPFGGEADRLLVADPLAQFEDQAGFLDTNALDPHRPPVRTLVNLAHVALAVKTEEGVLLHLATTAEPRKLLVDAWFEGYADEAIRSTGT